MHVRVAAVVVIAAALCFGTASPVWAQSGDYAPIDRPGPALSERPEDLERSVSCSEDAATAAHPPVLLLPATTVTSAENYGWNWIPALRAEGIPVCTSDSVVAPQNMGDHQIRAEYVVHAIRFAYEAAGRRPIAILGHSQGGQIMRWALRFWPDTRAMVDDVVSIAAPHHGSELVGPMCVPDCAPAIWQQRSGSLYTEALNSGQETFAGISYTNVYSRLDEFVQPNLDDTGTSSLHTGNGRITNVAVQDVCPTAVSDHLSVGTYDPVAYALGMDALRHDGPADPERIDRIVCAEVLMPGVEPSTFAVDYATAFATVATVLAGAEHVPHEPELRCYVFANCAEATDGAADPSRSTRDAEAAEPRGDDARTTGPLTESARLPVTGGGGTVLTLGLFGSALGLLIRRRLGGS